MEKVKILVVEDEIIIADSICNALNELGYHALEPAINFTEAIITIENEKPDIGILDIQLSGKKNGIDLAKKIKTEYNFPFIFLTSNSDSFTIQEAKQVTPHAYLIKPFLKEELYSSIEIALHNFSIKSGEVLNDNLIIKDALFIKDRGYFTKINFNDILFLKSDHVYIEIFLIDHKKKVVRTSLNNILTKLNHYFVRVHRGYIINTNYITQINHHTVKIENKEIPIGNKFRDEIVKLFKSI
ncbi:MAG: response regulator transcription factor [Flavobacteriia bacterium]|nr:response regulator transcription factor [Flavobacteriia bacterium]OIP45498.1 MAG: DNA-binding response regulator [Flavobacteriaceae bacterium CG2_30_31_66]PIV96752.1 MAG: DNA-binding response regulator [Flavobacteriaceae bacterium CG17_big_fil_post_rev_8_21_14_2_50_31_13]PIX11248.1 MAG: DNA-binding response regulator [Flavobacteriaceae bacterium CG_4_8_14_3_um_filter_31_8]PIY14926.1 MAG: DNA-binding response regulator [Flavobacteriaceae bacterium CG_4_10_14_3_um_filter_31_253]PIZ11618.1 MAG